MSGDKMDLEEGFELCLDFGKLGKAARCGQDLIPVVVQDVETREVLILAYVNEEALNYAREKRVATFWSTSRNELWIKGATSGDFLDLEEIRVNCEQNSLLYLVRLRGKGACHTKDARGISRLGCFYRKIEEKKLAPV